jgi:hypothetical protein
MGTLTQYHFVQNLILLLVITGTFIFPIFSLKYHLFLRSCLLFMSAIALSILTFGIGQDRLRDMVYIGDIVFNPTWRNTCYLKYETAEGAIQYCKSYDFNTAGFVDQIVIVSGNVTLPNDPPYTSHPYFDYTVPKTF